MGTAADYERVVAAMDKVWYDWRSPVPSLLHTQTLVAATAVVVWKDSTRHHTLQCLTTHTGQGSVGRHARAGPRGGGAAHREQAPGEAGGWVGDLLVWLCRHGLGYVCVPCGIGDPCSSIIIIVCTCPLPPSTARARPAGVGGDGQDPPGGRGGGPGTFSLNFFPRMYMHGNNMVSPVLCACV